MLGKCLWGQADYEMWGKNKPSFNSWDLCPYFNHYVTTLSDFRDSDIFVIFYRTTWEGQWAGERHRGYLLENMWIVKGNIKYFQYYECIVFIE